MWLVKANDKFMQCLPMKVLVILQKIILALASTFVFLAMVIEVFVRYVLKSDLFGIEEIILAAVFYLYFFGGSLAGYEDSQIKADLISGALRNKPKGLHLLGIIRNLIEATCAFALAYYTILQIQSNLVLGPCTTTLKIPYNVPQAAILVGWILMGFYPFLRMLRELGLFIAAFKKGEGEVDA